MLINLYFMPLEKISIMSLNGLLRRVATRDKNLIEPRMDELLVVVDLGN
jgi:hypothetical protein